MTISKWTCVCVAAAAFASGFALRGSVAPPVAHAQGNRVFEIRTYTAVPGRLDALNTRFRDHTVKLFTKHGMSHIGYWIPADGEKANNTLVYILAYPSKEAAAKSWAAFRADPEWNKARTESEKDGPLLVKNGVQSVYMKPTDYSPMK